MGMAEEGTGGVEVAIVAGAGMGDALDPPFGGGGAETPAFCCCC